MRSSLLSTRSGECRLKASEPPPLTPLPSKSHLWGFHVLLHPRPPAAMQGLFTALTLHAPESCCPRPSALPCGAPNTTTGYQRFNGPRGPHPLHTCASPLVCQQMATLQAGTSILPRPGLHARTICTHRGLAARVTQPRTCPSHLLPVGGGPSLVLNSSAIWLVTSKVRPSGRAAPLDR